MPEKLRHSHAVWNLGKIRRFQRHILDWYGSEKRDLPWRSHPDPYRVWISEIMLQQTQVQTVLPYYQRFLERFPDVESLAAGTETEVLRLWSGLGYYSRARNLRHAAQKIMCEFRGGFPDTMEKLLDLPGIGRYTAGAIHSIAFNSPQPVVDGNVKRVISRLHGIQDRIPESFFWAQAEAWVSPERPADFNQAVMELGALVCTHRKPACCECPARIFCVARKKGIQDQIPSPRIGRTPERVELAVLILECAGNLLLSGRHPAPYIPGRYALPGCILNKRESPELAARRLARSVLGLTIPIQPHGSIRHTITYRRIVAHVFHTALSGTPGNRPLHEDLLWVARSEIDRFLTSALYRKALKS